MLISRKLLLMRVLIQRRPLRIHLLIALSTLYLFLLAPSREHIIHLALIAGSDRKREPEEFPPTSFHAVQSVASNKTRSGRAALPTIPDAIRNTNPP